MTDNNNINGQQMRIYFSINGTIIMKKIEPSDYDKYTGNYLINSGAIEADKYDKIDTLAIINGKPPNILPRYLKCLTLNTCNNVYSIDCDLPNTLMRLSICDTPIRVLPKLPQSLTLLQCYKGELTELPILPDSLFVLNCYGNNIKRLPKLPRFLNELNVFKNPLEELPDPYNPRSKFNELKRLDGPIVDIIEREYSGLFTEYIKKK